MRKVIAVIRREFIERVRTRAFVISTILFPLLMTMFTVLPAILLRRASGTKHVAVVEGVEGTFGIRATEALLASRRRDTSAPIPFEVERFAAVGRVDAVRDSILSRTGLSRKRQVADGFDGVLVLTEETLVSGKIQYYGTNVGSIAEMRRLEGILQPVVQRERLERLGVDPGVVLKAVGRVDLITQKVAEGKLTGQSGEATFGLAYGMVFILYLTLMIYGSQVMTSVVEEKSSRIIEVLASSLRPFELMLGKVVGVGLVGLFQLSIWAATALYLGSFGASFMGRMGGDPGDAAAAAASAGGPSFLAAISPALVVIFLVLFILGFLFYAAMFAAVGSMCSTVQDTQQVMMPVTLPIMLGIMTIFALVNDPNGTLGRVITFIPFWAPFALPVRYSITPLPLGEVLASIAMMVLSVIAVAWVAGRVYRVGILSYGKKASFRDMARWIRTA
ncbi:MAG TPA: ABC transporter permease [Gemmatimonadales bacterium]|jgi:ABC-2 type transport system permease protein|nr:ABC transporter permease [Gemmatimonadales bacterium]